MAPRLLSYDVAIVGAGPAGSSAAYECSKAGLRVALFEEDAEVGVPIQCGEGLSAYAFEAFDIRPSKDLISQEVGTLRVIFPNGNWMLVREKGYELNRDKFDQHLARRATEVGCDLFTSSKITSFDPSLKLLLVNRRRNKGEGWANEVVQVRAEIVIGADGSKSNIAQWGGLLAKDDWHSNLIRAYELKVEGVDIDGFNLYFLPKIAPGGYAWIFQKGKAIANIGIATTERDSVVRLERFMKHLDLKGRIISRTGGAIPYRGPVRRSYGDGVMVVGDAAGQTNPIFLGGIFTAMQCGRIAGEVAVESIKARDVSAAFLSRYEKAWRRLPLADDSLVRTAKIIHSSTPEQWDSLGRLIGKLDLTSVTRLTKMRIILKTLLPQYWSLVPLVPSMPMIMKAFEITRRWGW